MDVVPFLSISQEQHHAGVEEFGQAIDIGRAVAGEGAGPFERETIQPNSVIHRDR